METKKLTITMNKEQIEEVLNGMTAEETANAVYELIRNSLDEWCNEHHEKERLKKELVEMTSRMNGLVDILIGFAKTK